VLRGPLHEARGLFFNLLERNIQRTKGNSLMLSTKPSTVQDNHSAFAVGAAQAKVCSVVRKKIWIDLDNSPHVPFFSPIAEELENRGYSVLLTARDCFQVKELSDLMGLKYKLIGHHYGKNTVMKIMGLCTRALQMLPIAKREKPSLALSHGSRSQLILAKLLGIPAAMIGDYEFSTLFAVVRPEWLIVPEVIPDAAVSGFKSKVLKYPGIKEDVYAPKFVPQSQIVEELGLGSGELIVTIRPPATEAHYHVPESDELFDEVLTYLAELPNIKMILLPRNEKQAISIREERPALFDSGKITIPKRVVDGLNLVWYSDLVISGGGTMNREAAALGVPVYSIFRGKIGAVDNYLASSGRLTLIESREEVRSKLLLKHRVRPERPVRASDASLQSLVEHIISIVERPC
jgi:predicted glycosyltransferase